MRTEASAFRASPLTVWVGSMRFVFAPGRDVIVGYGPGCDIALDRLGNPTSPPPAPRPEVVLRFAGTQWVAIDLSHTGIFVDGARVSTVNIRNGQAISIGDPQRGPRLVFQTGHPAGPPGQVPPGQAPRPPPYPPPPSPPLLLPRHHPPGRTIRTCGLRPSATPSACAFCRRSRRRPSLPAPALTRHRRAQPTAAADEQTKGPGLIERMITRKLRVARPSFRAAEAERHLSLAAQRRRAAPSGWPHTGWDSPSTGARCSRTSRSRPVRAH